MNNIRVITAALLRDLPGTGQGSPDQEFQRTVLTALTQIGDQLNSIDRRVQAIETTTDRTLREIR